MIGVLLPRIGSAGALMAGALALLVEPVPAQSPVPTSPSGAVRSLHHVQDAIAQGDRPAFQMQADLLAVVDQLIGALDANALEQAEQRQALLTYAVTGGNPATLIRVREAFPGIDFGDQTDLAQIITAVVLRRPIGEDQIVDAAAPSGMLGGGLALLSAINAEDPAVAARLLNAAILDAPGTLIEESALRRLMNIQLEDNDIPAFLATSSRYARQYVSSPYASDFAAILVAGGMKMQSPAEFEELSSVFEFMPTMYRKAIVARQMRAATLDGKFALVRYLGDRFADDVDTSDVPIPEAAAAADTNVLRQRLFFVMANIATLDHAEVAAELAAINPARLPESDRQLLAAARQVVADITRPANASSAAAPVREAGGTSPTAPGGVRVVLPAAGFEAPSGGDAMPASIRERMSGASPRGSSTSGADAEPDMTRELDGFISSTRDVLDNVDELLSEQ